MVFQGRLTQAILLWMNLDDEFPLGDGTADVDALVWCPYCGEENTIAVDPGSGPVQHYVEDCQVCCRPWSVTVRFDAQGHAWAEVRTQDE